MLTFSYSNQSVNFINRTNWTGVLKNGKILQRRQKNMLYNSDQLYKQYIYPNSSFLNVKSKNVTPIYQSVVLVNASFNKKVKNNIQLLTNIFFNFETLSS